MEQVVRVGVTLAVFVLLACAACGGGDGDAGAETGAGASAERAPQDDATERAEAVVLQLSDFPSGWRASAPEADDEEAQRHFRECLGVDYSGITIIGEGESKDFAMGQSAEASSEAIVLESEAEAEQSFEKFSTGMSGEAVEGCVEKLIGETEEIEEDFELGEIDVGELSFSAPDVDEARAWQIAVPIELTSGESKGISATAYLDIVQLREGDIVASMTTSDVLTPFDSALREELLTKVADRMTSDVS